jgi:hypothetical protein
VKKRRGEEEERERRGGESEGNGMTYKIAFE